MGIFDALFGGNSAGTGDPVALARSAGVSGEPRQPYTVDAPQTLNDRLMSPLAQAGLALMANQGTLKSQRGQFEGVGEALTGAARYQEAKREKNKTKAYLRENFPHLADQVDAGLDVGDAFKMSLQERQFEREMALSRERIYAPTSDMQNYREMKKDPAFAGYMGSRYGGEGGRAPSGYRWASDGTLEAIPGGPAASAGRAANAPSGFRWADPEQTRLEPIPGGPGEQIGAENAGRIGIADSFLSDLPAIRQEVNKGGVTGAVDATLGRVGYGEQGRLYARIESGADALQRMLSGAGMPESEAQAYARRYMPSASDSAAIVNEKLNQLERELTAQRNVVLRGRGGGGSSFGDPAGDVRGMTDADLEAIANGR